MIIRDPTAADEEAWRALWAGYLDFYETIVPDDVTATTWTRCLDPTSPLVARLAESGGEVVGFTISVIHLGTWTPDPVCYLEDLYVASAHRGSGIGRALIDDLISLGHERGWSRIYWHTRRSNEAARRLYDSYVEADDFVRYRLIFR
jgi:ribosomal protein S18 acetylase RimI-like enzyme